MLSPIGIGAIASSGSAGPAEPTYLLRDEFITNENPVSSPRTCEPGPGTLTFVNTVTGGNFSISGGELLIDKPSGGQGYDKYGFYEANGLARVVGRAVYALNVQSNTTSNATSVAWHTAATLPGFAHAKLEWASTATLQVSPGAGGDISVGSGITADVDYHTAIIMRSDGYAFLIKGGAQYPSWTPLYVSAIGNVVTLYPLLNNFNSQMQLEEWGAIDLSAPFDSGFGWATYHDATPTANDTAAGEADGITEFTWTPASAETLSIYFRRTDDDNTYRLDCSEAGNTIKLYRRDTATDTELDAGKTQTFTAGLQYRIVIWHNGGAIRTFVELSTGVSAKHVVTGETFNLAVTGVKCAGFTAGSDFAAWPGALSGNGITDLAL